MMGAVPRCMACGEKLDSDEIESPRRLEDGTIVCDDCFDRAYAHYAHTCPICEEYFYEDPTQKISPKHLLISECVGDELGVPAGVYEIIAYPFFRTSLIKSAIHKIHDFPDDIDEDDLDYLVFYLCDNCVSCIMELDA